MPNTEQQLLSELNLNYLFLVWGTPDQGPRSRVMSNKLGIEVFFVQTFLARGALYAPLKYILQTIKTIPLLFAQRPDVVFVQSPPLLVVFLTYLYCQLTGTRYVVDAHSAAFMGPWWSIPPTWLKKLLARKAITTIVTNEHLQKIVNGLGGHSLIVQDIPTTFQVEKTYPVDGQFNIALINTFAPDEPLDNVLQAATQLPDVHFYVTGKLKQSAIVNNGISSNVHFTDFLPDDAYYSLLNAANAVMCLTTRNHTMQRGACEALSLGKPVITSDWPVLRQYFNKGTIHVDNSVEAIQEGVLKMRANLSDFNLGIKELQRDQQHEWQEKIKMLVSLIKNHPSTE